MIKTLTSLVIVLFCSSVFAFEPTTHHLIFLNPEHYLAQLDSENVDTTSSEAVDESIESEDSSNEVSQDSVETDDSVTSLLEKEQPQKGFTTPKKRFFQSALIPGWGQLSNGCIPRAILFLGLDAFCIYKSMDYNKQANDKEDEYEAFADEHFDSTLYQDFIQNYEREHGLYYDNGDPNTPNLPEIFTHTWDYEEDPQQYYEMIGKYKQFYMGWDDGVSDSTQLPYERGSVPLYGDYLYSSKRALEYMDMRHESNQMFEKSKNMLYFMMGNHLLSAVEAAWTASRMPKKIEESTGLKNSRWDLTILPQSNDMDQFVARCFFKANF